jgi:drug/metabolite transporter (DMT)-like permease
VLGVVLASTMWGLSSVLMKVALPGIPPLGIALARVVLSGLVLVPAAIVRGRGGAAVAGPRDRVHLAVLAVTTVAVPFCLTAWAQQHVDAASAAVLHATVPLWTTAFAVVLLGQRPGARQFAAIGAGLAGVAVLAGFGSAGAVSGSWRGCLAVLAASACYGFGWVYLRRNLSHRPPLYIAAAIQAGAVVVLLPVAAATTDPAALAPTPARLASLVALGVVSTAGAELLNYHNIARLGPTTASLTAYLVPIVGVTAGIAVLGEPLTGRLIGGAAIVLASTGLALPRRAGTVGAEPIGESAVPEQ